jgi:hypothetical protein
VATMKTKIFGAILVIAGVSFLGVGIDKQDHHKFMSDFEHTYLEATRNLEALGGPADISASDLMIQHNRNADRRSRKILMFYGAGGVLSIVGVFLILRRQIQSAWAEGRPKAEQSANVFDCIDCGGTVSKNAVACPHCGCTDFMGQRSEDD